MNYHITLFSSKNLSILFKSYQIIFPNWLNDTNASFLNLARKSSEHPR